MLSRLTQIKDGAIQHCLPRIPRPHVSTVGDTVDCRCSLLALFYRVHSHRGPDSDDYVCIRSTSLVEL